jgi:hypothetical protein
MSSTALNIGFTRVLSRNKWDRWVHLVSRLTHVQLSDDEDVYWWNLTPSGLFTVRSMYLDLLNGRTVYLKNYIWKIKVPFKIRIFMWFLHPKVILTKDNSIKRNWKDCSKYCFCDQDETINHLFFYLSFRKSSVENYFYDFQYFTAD